MRLRPGGVAERLNAPVLKTGKVRAFEGSNPSPSAIDQIFAQPLVGPDAKMSAWAQLYSITY